MAEVTNEYHSRITRSEKLLFYPYAAVELELGSCESFINSQMVQVRERSLKKKIDSEAVCH